MSRPVPPSPQRLLRARAAGLRPRARWWTLAWMCAAAAGALQVLATSASAPDRLHAHLARALSPTPSSSAIPHAHDLGLGALALLLAGALALAGLALARGRPPTLRLASPPTAGGEGPADAPPLGAAALLALLGVALALALLQPVLAGAARSVDASATGLGALWILWPRRALLGAAGIAALLGVGERLASAQRLRTALHLAPEQLREHPPRARGPALADADAPSSPP